jgi:hypothetical protein
VRAGWTLASLLLLAAAAPAAPEGTFVHDPGESDDVAAAVERAAGDFNFLLRPFARSRLIKANPVPGRIRIVYEPHAVSVQLDRTPPVRAPRDGRTVEWIRDDGAVFDLTARTEEGVLRQSFRGADGTRVNVYRLGGDGRTLSMEVTITSPRLRRPLTYTLVYRRA